jgi:hypothetical protein
VLACAQFRDGVESRSYTIILSLRDGSLLLTPFQALRAWLATLRSPSGTIIRQAMTIKLARMGRGSPYPTLALPQNFFWNQNKPMAVVRMWLRVFHNQESNSQKDIRSRPILVSDRRAKGLHSSPRGRCSTNERQNAHAGQVSAAQRGAAKNDWRCRSGPGHRQRQCCLLERPD